MSFNLDDFKNTEHHPDFMPCFLVATNVLDLTYFEKSVIVLINHSDEAGSFGLIVNRPEKRDVPRELFEHLDIPETNDAIKVMSGGPVDLRSPIIVLQEKETLSQPPVFGMVGDESSDRFSLIRIYTSYSGWSPGQLQSEIDRNTWLLMPLHPKFLYDQNHDTMWERLLAFHYGKGIFSGATSTPEFN